MISNSRVFAFGKNWGTFINNYITQDCILEAKKSIVEFLGKENLEGKTFIDVGCGSGLFSLVAYQLGASEIFSFDADSGSVECCQSLRENAGCPDNWRIENGSILDGGFVQNQKKYDIVYSWGVLHHTGNMWKAIKNTAMLVSENGHLFMAIYNKADGLSLYPDGRFGPSAFWEKEKKLYSSMPLFIQNLIDYHVMIILIILYVLTFNNPLKKIKMHKKHRGMSWRVDIKDWLGGYPYEYASVAEVFRFVKKLGFTLENLRCNNGLLNNEYLFKKQ